MQDAFATEPTLSENERLDYVNDQLKLIQRTDGLTFGTDALLLAAYIGDGYRQALEIGAGSGILSLLLATRGKAEHITAVEIQPEYAELTARNVLCNRLSDKIGTVCRDVRDIPTPEIERYDLVFTNPPYLTCGSGRLCGLAQKSAARHEVHGTLTELLGAAARLLRYGGDFAAVYRPERLTDLLSAMRGAGIEPKRLTLVHPRCGSEASLVLVAGRRGARSGLYTTPPFILYRGEGEEYGEEMEYILREGRFPARFFERERRRRGDKSTPRPEKQEANAAQAKHKG